MKIASHWSGRTLEPARAWNSITSVRPLPARWTSIIPLPPIPHIWGSTTPWQNAVVMAASTAFPPCRSTSRPASAARGCGQTIMAGISLALTQEVGQGPVEARRLLIGDHVAGFGKDLVAGVGKDLADLLDVAHVEDLVLPAPGHQHRHRERAQPFQQQVLGFDPTHPEAHPEHVPEIDPSGGVGEPPLGILQLLFEHVFVPA